MIPYFQFVSFKIGPLTIYAWGVFVVLGILVGLFLLYRRGFFKKDWNLNLVLYLMIAAILGGRLGYVLFYDFSYFLKNPIDIFKIWEGGMSSFGGFLLVGTVLLIATPKRQKLKYLDILTIPFVITWIIARIGCFMIHDHVGRLSDFFLAVQFPGGTRHDMALYEILLMVIFLAFYALSSGAAKWRPRFQATGLPTAIVIIYYTVARFFLDFLRATDLPNSDPRYFGLLPSQYGAILFFILGLVIIRKVLTKNSYSDKI